MIISHLINLLLLITAISANHGIDDEHFDEQLIIRSLNDGQISAHFEFKTFINANLSYPFGGKFLNLSNPFLISLILFCLSGCWQT